MSTALYRRYRPDTFGDMIGQEHVTEPLMQALRSNRVNHAYLFSGPRGCGKTTSARILARILNCAENTEANPTDTPCGVCPSCLELATGGSGSLDVVEIDAASHGGVDDARDLRERATFSPTRDRFKIFILDEAHMVTAQGFNALLKIVEEPPPYLKFIFATTEPEKVIGTIRSRTHHYPFKLVAPDTMHRYLEQLCQAEGISAGEGVLPLVVRAGGGSVRDTLSVLDQLIAGAQGGQLQYDSAVALLGFTPSTLLDDVAQSLVSRDGAALFGVIEQIINTGHEPRRFIEDLLERLRDLVVISLSGDGARSIFSTVPADQFERMVAQAQSLGSAELSRSADVVNSALSEMSGATSPRLHLELLCARLLLPAADGSASGLGARIDGIERALAGGAVPSGAVPSGGVSGGAVSRGVSGPTVAGSADGGPAGHAPVEPSQATPVSFAPVASSDGTRRVSLRPESTRRKPADAPASARPQQTEASSVPTGLGQSTAPTGIFAQSAPSPERAAPRVQETVSQTQSEPVAAAPQAERVAESAPRAAESAPREPVVAPVPVSEQVAQAVPAAQPATAMPAAPTVEAQRPEPAAPVTQAEQPDPRAAATASAAPAQASAPAQAQPSASASSAESEAFKARWPEVLEALAGHSRALWALVNQYAKVEGLDANAAYISMPNAQLLGTLAQRSGDQQISAAIKETLGFDVQVVIDLEGSPKFPKAGSSPAPAAAAPGNAEAHPVAHTAPHTNEPARVQAPAALSEPGTPSEPVSPHAPAATQTGPGAPEAHLSPLAQTPEGSQSPATAHSPADAHNPAAAQNADGSHSPAGHHDLAGSEYIPEPEFDGAHYEEPAGYAQEPQHPAEETPEPEPAPRKPFDASSAVGVFGGAIGALAQARKVNTSNISSLSNATQAVVSKLSSRDTSGASASSGSSTRSPISAATPHEYSNSGHQPVHAPNGPVDDHHAPEPPSDYGDPYPHDDYNTYDAGHNRTSTGAPTTVPPWEEAPQGSAIPTAVSPATDTAASAHPVAPRPSYSSSQATPVAPSGQDFAAGTVRETPRQAAQRRALEQANREAERRKIVDDPQPDDEDLESTGLVGVPLVIAMLGGVIIEEITDEV